MAGLPLLELFVQISTKGLKDVEKDLAKIEAMAKKAEDGPMGRLLGTKDAQKDLERQTGLLDKFGNKIEEIQKKAKKGINLGFDDTKIRENSNALAKLMGDVEKLQSTGKKGITLKVKLDGEKDVLTGLEAIEKEIDKVKGVVTVRCKLEGNEETIAGLEDIEGIAIRVDGNDVEIDCKLNGDEETFQRLSLLRQEAEKLDGKEIDMSVNLKGALEASEDLRKIAAEADKVDGRKIDLTTDLEGKDQVIAGLQLIKEKGDELEHDKIEITMGLRGNEEVVKELTEIEGLAVKIDGNKVTITIDENGGPETIAEMEAVLAKGREIDGKKLTMHVEARGGAEVITELAAVNTAADKVDGRNIKMSFDRSFIDQMQSARAEMDRLAEAVRNLQTIAVAGAFAGLISILAGLAPVLTAATAAAAGLANVLGGALVGAATSAGSAIGILVGALGLITAPIAMAVHGFSDYEKALQKSGKASSEAKDKAHALEQAQRRLGDAQQGVADAQESAAEKVQEANERYQESIEKVGEAQEKASEQVAAAQEHAQEAADKVGEAQEKAAERSAAAQEKYQESLQKVEDAERKGQDARHQLEDATKSLTSAQQDLNHALRDEPLEQAEAELNAKEARLGMAEATQRVTDAQTKLNEAQTKGDPNKVADAELALQEAQLGTERATLRNQKAENQLSDTREQGSKQLQSATKGVEQASEGQEKALQGIEEADRDTAKAREESGKAFQEISKAELEGQKDVAKAQKESQKASDEVAKAEIEGQKNVAKAQKDSQKAFEGIAKAQKDGAKQIEQAQRQLEDAEYAVARAMEKMGESSDDASGKLANLTEAQKRLFDAIIQFKKDAQAAFEPATNAAAALGEKVLTLATTFLPQLGKASLQAMEGLTRAFDTFAMQIQEAGPQKAIQDILDTMARVVEPVARALGELGIAFVTAFSIALPYGEHLIDVLTKAAHQVYLFTQSVEGIEILSDIFAKTYETAVRLWDVFVDLGTALYNLFALVNETGISEQVLSGLETMAQNFRDITTEGTEMHDRIKEHLEALKPVISALNDLLGELVNQFFLLAERVAAAVDPETGMGSLVELLDGIRDAIAPIGDALATMFEEMAPVLAELIPNLATFVDLLVHQLAPVMADMLGAVSDLIGWFNELPAPLRDGALQAAALGLAFFGIIGALKFVLSPFITVVKWALVLSKITGLSAVIAPLLGLEAVGAGATTAATGLSAMLIPLLALAALGAIIVYVAVNFDKEAAAKAEAEARASGETSAGAWGAGFLAGLESTPITGDIVKWIDDNIAKPIDDLKEQVMGRQDLDLGEWLRVAMLSNPMAWQQALAGWLAQNIAEPLKNFLSNLTLSDLGEYLKLALLTNPVGWGAVLGSWLAQNISQPIKDFLGNLGLSDLGEYLKLVLLTSPIGWGAALGSWLAQNILEPIKTFLGALGLSDLGEYLKLALLTNPAGWGAALGSWLAQNIAQPIKDFLGSLDLSDLGEYLRPVLLTNPMGWGPALASWLAENISQPIKDFFSKLDVGEAAKGAFEKVKTAVLGELGETKKEAVSDSIVPDMVSEIIDAFTGLAGDTEQPMSDFKAAVLDPTNELLTTVPGSITDMATQVGGSFTTLATDSGVTWQGLQTDIGKKVDSIVSDSTTKIGSLVTDLGTKWTEFKTATGTTWESLKTDIGTKVDSIVTTTKQKIDDLVTALKQKFNDLWTEAKRIWEGIKTDVTQRIEDTRTEVERTVDRLKENLDNAWTDIKKAAQDAWEAVGKSLWEPVEEGWNKAKGIWNSIIDAIQGVASKLGLKGVDLSGAKFAEGGTTREHAKGGAYDGKRGGVSAPKDPKMHLWGEGDWDEAYITSDPRHRRENIQYASIAASLVGGEFVPPAEGGFASGFTTGPIQQVWNTDNVGSGSSRSLSPSSSGSSSGSSDGSFSEDGGDGEGGGDDGGDDGEDDGEDGGDSGSEKKKKKFERRNADRFGGGPYEEFNIDMDADTAREMLMLTEEEKGAFDPGPGYVYGDIPGMQWLTLQQQGWRGFSSDMIEAIYPPGAGPGFIHWEDLIDEEDSGSDSGSSGSSRSGSGRGSSSGMGSSGSGRSTRNSSGSSGSGTFSSNKVAGYIAGPGSYSGSFSFANGGTTVPMRSFHFGGQTKGKWVDQKQYLQLPGQEREKGDPYIWDPDFFGPGLPGVELYGHQEGGLAPNDLSSTLLGVPGGHQTAGFKEDLGAWYEDLVPGSGGIHQGVDVVGNGEVYAPAAGTVTGIDTSHISTALDILMVDYQGLNDSTTYGWDYIHTGDAAVGGGDTVKPGQFLETYGEEYGPGSAHAHMQTYPFSTSDSGNFSFETNIDPYGVWEAVTGNLTAPPPASAGSGKGTNWVRSAFDAAWNSTVKPLLDGVAGQMGQQVLAKMAGQVLTEKLAPALKTFLLSKTPGTGKPPDAAAQESSSAGTDEAREWARQGLMYAGLPVDEQSIEGILAIMEQETHFQNIPNNEGSGASGPMQVMPETFDANKVNDGDDIWNPVQNVAAAARYMIAMYGHILSRDEWLQMGSYSMGGLATGPTVGVFGEAGKEMVLPLENRQVQSEIRDILGTIALEQSFSDSMGSWRSQAQDQHAALVHTLRNELGLAEDHAERLAAKTGAYTATATDTRIAGNWRTRDAQVKAHERAAEMEYLKGAW